MCEGDHWTFRGSRYSGRMRGGGRAWFGSGYRWHGPWHGHGQGQGECRCECGRWRGEPAAEDELAFLRSEAGALGHYLEGIERRMGELEKAGA